MAVPKVKPINVQPVRATSLEQRFNQSNMVQPLTRPAPEDTPFDQLTKVASRVGQEFYGVINKINSSGNRRSPSTVKDRSK